MSIEDMVNAAKMLESEIKILEKSLDNPGNQLVAETIKGDAHAMIMATAAGDPNACVFAVAKYQGLYSTAEMASDMIEQKRRRRESLIARIDAANEKE